MRYQIKQKVFSLSDNFTIKDEFNNDCFTVRGKMFSVGNKLKIEDKDGNQLINIEQKLLSFLPTYQLLSNGNKIATIKKEFTLLKPRFKIESSSGSYKMQGDLFSRDFQITRDDNTVATVSKKFFSLGDTYGVEVSDGEDHGFILALVIVIDQILHKDSK